MVFSAAFYDSHVTTHVLVDNGDMVVLQARCRGVHKGDFYGVAPTGRRVQTVGICVFRFVDGLIAESWSSFEIQGLLTSMTAPHDPVYRSQGQQRRLA
jgi:predicted ester cyclase